MTTTEPRIEETSVALLGEEPRFPVLADWMDSLGFQPRRWTPLVFPSRSEPALVAWATGEVEHLRFEYRPDPNRRYLFAITAIGRQTLATFRRRYPTHAAEVVHGWLDSDDHQRRQLAPIVLAELNGAAASKLLVDRWRSDIDAELGKALIRAFEILATPESTEKLADISADASVAEIELRALARASLRRARSESAFEA